MRKRKPKGIGIERASKLMHDLGLRTPEDIERRYQEIIRRNPAARKHAEEMERHINTMVDHMFRPINFEGLAEKMTPEIFAALSEKIGDCETIDELAAKLGGHNATDSDNRLRANRRNRQPLRLLSSTHQSKGGDRVRKARITRRKGSAD